MAVDLDEPIKRDHTANVKNDRIRRLAATSVSFNGIPSIAQWLRNAVWIVYNVDYLKIYFDVREHVKNCILCGKVR